METTEANVGKMETQLKQWGAKLDELVAKANTEAKADYHQLIDDLKAKYQIVQSRFDELKAAGSDKMATFKDGMESAWNAVEVAFKKLKGGAKDQAGER
jgi:hypothetical protein